MAKFIDYNYALREEMKDKNFYLTSISSRQCLEDTYSQHLHRTGLASKLRYKVILALIYWE